jgi:hypothetical protein
MSIETNELLLPGAESGRSYRSCYNKIKGNRQKNESPKRLNLKLSCILKGVIIRAFNSAC